MYGAVIIMLFIGLVFGYTVGSNDGENKKPPRGLGA
jgi:hypothetical protein